jgi:NAD(P)H-dependent FMN reductase
MTSILGISGSLRKGSYNTALLSTAQKLLPGVIQSGDISEVPLYDGDIESAGIPDSVLRLKQQLAESSGLLLASPEYNNSVPGVLKNAIDWLSRPSGSLKNVFRDKPVAVMGASPGGFGTVMAQSAWLPVFRSLGARHWSGGRLMVSGAGSLFDERGELSDTALQERLEKYITGFRAFCER